MKLFNRRRGFTNEVDNLGPPVRFARPSSHGSRQCPRDQGRFIARGMAPARADRFRQPRRNPSRDSIALFYLASLVSVHRFADGNKRADHAAYAICMSKNNHYFKAPTLELENRLTRMSD
jgi:hypothetical protein